jgi:hypothetical protein
VQSRPALPAAPGKAGALVMEPEHLATLTAAQREDIRLWHGHVNLFDRIKAIRGYVLLTAGMWAAGITGFVLGIEEGVPPAVLAPLVPIYMSRKLWLRGRSLREAGLKLRRVFLLPRAKWVLPAPSPAPSEARLLKLASKEVLASPHGTAIRRAEEERLAIMDIIGQMSKTDRALLPDVVPTVDALVERVAHVADALHRLEHSFDPRLIDQLDARLAELGADHSSPEGERRLALLGRQRATLEELVQRRTALARQLDNAGLALANLRYDLIKLRSSGLKTAMSDVSTATQEARALSREIGMVLDAVDEVQRL